MCVFILKGIVGIEHVERITKGSLDLHMSGKEMKTTFGYMEKKGENNKNITWKHL
jgi:hypothetical protein